MGDSVGNNEKITGGCTGKGFTPGKSGNPTGRPKRALVTDQIIKLLKQKNPKTGKPYAQAVAEGLIKELARGKNAKELLDRIEGPITQAVNVTGNLDVHLFADELAAVWEREKADG